MKYDELPFVEGSEDRHAWDVFGRGDQLGALNRLDASRVLAAAGLIQRGRVLNLNLPLNQPGPITTIRGTYTHVIDRIRGGRDDHLDGFHLQGSTHWDGLSHIRHRSVGYYGGRTDEDLDAGGLLGIDTVARHGMAGRAVLIDIERYYMLRDRAWSYQDSFAITPTLIEDVAAAQGLTNLDGDILLGRTGWLPWFLSLDANARAEIPPVDKMTGPGLDPGAGTARWLWDHGFVAVATDTPAVEVLPVSREVGFLHHRALTFLGILLGECFWLDGAAADAEADGAYEGFLFSAPLNLPGGTGSPANAYLIK